MSLPSGTRLGPYEILAPIGAGGMGEVYRARDTKLDRDVAIKILPDAFAADPERLARFEREAKTLASLNHPHIAQVFGLESGAIVMELVDGEDLSERLTRGKVPLEDAVPIARQIAEAVEAAHDAGVIHRDLKPANVKVRADGTVKVLDFGLARTMDGGPGTGDLANSPTLTARATKMGMIIGTAAYMAPEQAKGRPVDKRADVWAFGCVVYELITGRRTFIGDDVSETLASVLRQDVDWTPLPAATPPRLRRLLERCLERDPKQRLRDIGEARVELAKIEAGVPDSGSMPMGRGAVATSQKRVPWLALALAGVAIAAIAAYVGYRSHVAPDPPVVRFKIMAPENSPFGNSLALSPDGRQLAFLAVSKSLQQVWVRALDAAEARPIAGTEGAEISVFWSPDSRSIGFWADGKVKRILASGGAAQTIADAPNFSGATWGKGDVIVFSPTSTSGLSSVPAAGGSPSPLTTPDASAGEQSHRWPSFLPDGRHFLYYARHPGGSPEGVIMVSSLDDPAHHTQLLKTNAHAVYTSSAGVLLFLSDRTLMAQSFDLSSFKLSGDPIPVAEDVGSPLFGRAGIGQYAVSDTGVLVHGPGSVPDRQYVWSDRHGKELSRLPVVAPLYELSLSPDGTRVAFRRSMNNNSDIWILELARGVASRFTFDPQSDQYPVWSPDSARIAFFSIRSGNGDIYVRPASGASPDELLYGTADNESATDWSRDGKRLLLSTRTPNDIFALPMTGDRTPQPIVTGPANEYSGKFSPDGQWIAYVSNESTRDEVYVQNLSAGAGKSQVSIAGGSSPVWRRDGRELFYLAPDRKLMAVPMKNGAPDGLPQTLFQTQITTATLPGYFDASADGQKFLVNSPAGAVVVTPLTVVLNWMPKKAGR